MSGTPEPLVGLDDRFQHLICDVPDGATIMGVPDWIVLSAS